MIKRIKYLVGIGIAATLLFGMGACTSSGTGTQETTQSMATTEAMSETSKEAKSAGSEGADSNMDTKIQVFVAASLKKSMEEVITEFQTTHPNVEVVLNADSSGKLMTQIQEGFECDVFFSAAKKQMDTLEEGGFLVENTRKNVVNNQLTVITLKDSRTEVTGLATLGLAKSIALADGSVPVGRYTRIALNKLGMIPDAEDLSKVTTAEVSEALGGVEISEQSNVSKVLAAVAENAAEVGTVYFSDTYGYEDKVQVLEKVSYDLTGNVIYPIAQIVNAEADETRNTASKEFVEFVTSDAAKTIFAKYYFDTNVE